MSVSQLDLAMANLRIRLAEIEDRERQLDAQVSQFRQQLRRVPRQAVYGQAGLETSLAAMGEIEERLADAEAVRGRLVRIKSTASQELEALVVLKQVDEARTTLSDLKRHLADGAPRNRGGDPAPGRIHRGQQQARRAIDNRALPRRTGIRPALVVSIPMPAFRAVQV